MRIPITRDGAGVLIGATIVLGVLAAVAAWVHVWLWIPFAALWVFVISFFRDPERSIDRPPNVLFSPADGKVTEVIELPGGDNNPDPCFRIRIFLSLFNVHINRMPCAASVKSIRHKTGRYLNAMNPASAEENESNTLILDPRPPFRGPIEVRQISGLIARTIVCHVREGDAVDSGQRFGMIKFGSGTEVIVPVQPGLRLLVQAGQTVHGGLTKLAELEQAAPRTD